MENNKPKIIAFYLPQFHPFKENDEWWGKGFTEWTNVGKAKPLFAGHIQPRVPADLGYYDLRLPIVREQQAQLAREAGVYGFCYWHYWFGNGFQIMNDIIDEVAASGKPDFPFCLGWANESWKSKLWDKDGKGDKILAKQIYGGESDYRMHYNYIKKLISHKNYIRINGKPFFLIYKPFDSPEVPIIMKLWNQWIKEDGIADEFYFVGNLQSEDQKAKALDMGFNYITVQPNYRMGVAYGKKNIFLRCALHAIRFFHPMPYITKMKNYNKLNPSEYDSAEDVIPFLFPQWDHTPRSGFKGSLVKSSPKLFYEQAINVLRLVKKKNNNLILLKSWNEWGEGNYMEPDLKWGKGYIISLREAIKKVYGY